MATCPKFDPANPPLPPPLPSINFMLIQKSCPAGAPATREQDPRCMWGVSVPWPVFLKESAVASGGNRYMTVKTVKVPPIPSKADTTIAYSLRNAADISKKQFQSHFGAAGNANPNATLKMSAVLAAYAGKYATEFGIVKVELMPKPDETAGEFVRRGGYLLWIDPQNSVFNAHVPVQSTLPWWAPGNIANFGLYIRYKPADATITYRIGLHYESDAQKALDKIGQAFAWAMQKACAAATSDKVAQASAYAAAYPTALPYIAAWTAMAGACGRAMPKCAPPTPPVAINLVPVQAMPLYPAGTIAWRDSSINLYRIAVPKGLAGFGPTHVEVARVPALPPTGVVLVGRLAWESATRPLYARTWFMGTSVGVGAIALTTLVTLAVRRRHAH